MTFPEILEFTITAEDYKNSTKNYLDSANCPLTVAARRIFGLFSKVRCNCNSIIIDLGFEENKIQYKSVTKGFCFSDYKKLEELGIEKSLKFKKSLY